jgi:F0F1-type ATP synthase gamma subunit
VLLPLERGGKAGLFGGAAMQRAEKNIDSLLSNLNRTFYRLRQSSIDEELFDVIAGFNALGIK